MNTPNSDGFAANLQPFENILSEQAKFLSPIQPQIAERWQDLYLNTFGRGSFFSSQRVQKTFRELTEIFVACLRDRELDNYFEALRERGIIFAKLGIPFEEVIISLHLFEEVCASEFLRTYPDRQKMTELVEALAELHSEGLAVMAGSYFESTKQDFKQITDGLQEENNSLKDELDEVRKKFSANSIAGLNSMQLMLSGINLKLRHRLYQLNRLQKLSEVLDGESYLPRLLKIAVLHMSGFCPKGSEIHFGFMDDQKKKVSLYSLFSAEQPHAELHRIFYFSEMGLELQDLLFDESKRVLHLKNRDQLPTPIRELVHNRNFKDFVFLPLRKFREGIGFAFIATQEPGFFCKNNYKFFQRVGQILGKAVTSATLFTKSKKQDDFMIFMDEISRLKTANQSFETVLDFCLGSLIDLLGAERTSLMQYDYHKKELRVCAAKGYKVYPISGHVFKWGEGVAGMALKESRIISIPRMKEHDKSSFIHRFLSNGEAPELSVKSLLCLPLLHAERPLGVVNISTINFYKDFDKSEIEMADDIVNRMSALLRDVPISA